MTEVTRLDALRIARDTLLRPEAERKPPVVEKRCGTCYWWEGGLCMWSTYATLPTWMDDVAELMGSDEGADCDVWQGRKSADNL